MNSKYKYINNSNKQTKNRLSNSKLGKPPK